jgi:putative oxidoreductase
MTALAARLAGLNAWADRATALLASPLLLAARLYVAWQFLKSGWLKLQDWDTTLFLFHEEYRVPLLPPDLAAIAGTAGEIAFPVLLIAGLLTRYAALGLSAVNLLAVVSYAHVLLSPGYEAAIGQHYLWGSLLLGLVLFGGGGWSADGVAARRADPRAPRSP